jgi:hypothetical protein
MATYQKYQDYTEQLTKAVHNWSTHTFKMAASNTAFNLAHDEFADLTEISAGNGYAAGGPALDTVTLAETSGTAKVTIADEVITATGAIGPMRYFSLYNDTSTGDKLVCGWDYGSAVTLANGETFTFDFDATNGIWQLV